MPFASQVSDHLADLSRSEARVARFMASHPHSVGHLSAARIAEESGTSDATVIRTVRRLGYDGLSSLRESLASELSMTGRLEASLPGRSAAASEGALSLITDRIETVTGLPDRIDEASLARAVEVMSSAERTCMVGFGPARHLAGYAAHQLVRVGGDAAVLSGHGRGFADELLRLRQCDAVIALAYDGVEAEMDALFDRTRELGIDVIQFCEDVLSADHRSAVALAAGRGDPALSPCHAATIVVLETLVLGVAARRPQRADRTGRLLGGIRQRLDGPGPRS